MDTNGIPLINGQLYSWGDVIVTIGGVPITGITGVEYSDKQEIVNKHGAGRLPVGRGKGRIISEGKISLYHEEVLALQRAAPNGRLQDLPVFDVRVSYIKTAGDPVITDIIRNCNIVNNPRKIKEGDTAQEVELELLPSHIEWGAKA